MSQSIDAAPFDDINNNDQDSLETEHNNNKEKPQQVKAERQEVEVSDLKSALKELVQAQ